MNNDPCPTLEQAARILNVCPLMLGKALQSTGRLPFNYYGKPYSYSPNVWNYVAEKAGIPQRMQQNTRYAVGDVHAIYDACSRRTREIESAA